MPTDAPPAKEITPEKEKPAKVAAKPSHRYSEAWDNSDIIFILDKEKFHCHYTILKFNSPVFRAMFKGDFKEGSEKSVKLPGKERESFITFLDLMYPLSKEYKSTTDRKILNKVLEYSDEYQVECVKLHVDNILFINVYSRKDIEKTVQVAMEDLRISEKYGLTETRRTSYNYLLSDDRSCSYDETVYQELPGEIKYDLITGKLNKFLISLSGNFTWDPMYQLLASICKEAKER